MTKITELSLIRNPETAPKLTEEALRDELAAATEAITAMVTDWAVRERRVTFRDFEKALRAAVFALARAAIALFFALREQHVMRDQPQREQRAGRTFRRAPAQARNLATLFGVVRYTRTYMREVAAQDRRGFHPLDVALGLHADRFSGNVLSIAARLATKLSFAEARATLTTFVPSTPSTEVIEQTVLGLGRYTAGWFDQAPPPDDDGEVLVIMIDGKGAPTATAEELARRRGKRRKRKMPASPRHRGRHRRARHAKKPRRSKGDKSKNAKMATMVVMYTLRRSGGYLLGPINRWQYASFAPKEHAFAIARREATKRGFADGAGKVVQIVTDGDDDLARYANRYFPNAIHTIDVIHVVEKLWLAGDCLFREGSEERRHWVERQRDRLYRGHVTLVLAELRTRLAALPKTGPGNKGKRKRLRAVLQYVEKRAAKMNYDELLKQDLEIGSGSVEGAVKNIIGKRCDHGGMRWIKERAEALLQLRCIDANGDWDAFIDYVHDRMQCEAANTGRRLRLQTQTPAPLPTVIPLAA